MKKEVKMVNIDLIKELRDKSGAGMMECKEALKESAGNIEEALVFLRKKGLAKIRKRAGHVAKQGIITAYIHTGGKVGAMVEVNCETDFVSRNDDFQQMTRDIAMQIVASNPLYIKREDVPAEVIEKEKEILGSQSGEKKTKEIMDKIIQGKLDKYFKDVCLLEQPFIKDPQISVEEYIHQSVAKIGEKLEVRRFSRYVLGEEID